MSRLPWVFFLLPVFAQAQSNTLFCVPGAIPNLVRSEGLTEVAGDVLFDCQGAVSGTVIQGNLTVFAPVSITNRVTASNTVDARLSVDTGSGPVLVSNPGVLTSSRSISFSGISFTVPQNGRVSMRLANLRLAVAGQGVNSTQPIRLQLSSAGSLNLALTISEIIVAIPQRGLLGLVPGKDIRCTPSPLPSPLTFAAFIAAKTRFFSARVTEGFGSAFSPKDAFSDTGTRIRVSYSGFPANARLFVPDAIAGNSALEPTGAGDLGSPASGGRWTASPAGSLLLIRVNGADSDGSGGTLAVAPASATFNTVGEVPITGGAGVAVFEVVDQNPSVRESAQVPTFLVFPGLQGGAPAPAAAEVSLAPANATSIPRFHAAEPPSDCPALGDCDAPYFPRLSVTSQSLDFRVLANQAPVSRSVFITNAGGGTLGWTAAVTYRSGSNWILLDPESGQNNGTVRVWVRPQSVSGPGTYQATLTINGGPLAGSRTAEVEMIVSASPVSTVLISGIASLANPQVTRLAPGARALIRGLGFDAGPLTATFDGLPGTVVSRSATEIDVRLPESLGSRPTAQLVVTAGDGRSEPFAVTIDPVSAVIFPQGVLNQDGSLNSASNGAAPGSALQIFATGVNGVVSVRVHDRTVTPFWAGPLLQYPGVVQANVFIPDDLPAMSTDIRICGTAPDQTAVCSAPVPLTIR